MPEYKWTLKNKKFCTGCPLKVMFSQDEHTCLLAFYPSVKIKKGDKKKRPAACVRELGE